MHTTQAQALVEYALILVAIAVVVILGLSVAGVSVREAYCAVAGGLGDTVCDSIRECTFAFDDGSDLDGWSGGDADALSVEDGRACITGDGRGADSYFNHRCARALTAGDYSIRLDDVTVDRAVQNNQNTGFDVWFRAQDDRNGYLFIYNSRTDYIRFWKIVEGRWIKLSQARTPSSWRDQALDFRVDVSGDTFTAYKDGERVLQASDDGYTTGQVGMRNKPSSKSCIGGMVVDDLS